MVQERYITLSAHKKNIEEARTFFDRTVNDVTSRLNHMDSRCEELDAVERLRILHDFYRVGEETQFQLDLADCMKRGRSFKDAVCPDSMEFKKDHFVMGGKYGRVLFLKDGRLFNELLRGERDRPAFYHEILDVLALLGGDVSDVT